MYDFEVIKSKNRIEDVIGESLTVTQGRGRYLSTNEHDSLIIDVQQQLFVWNSRIEQGWKGDVITWVELWHKLDTIGAAKYLAERAGINAIWDAGQRERFYTQRRNQSAYEIAANYLLARLLISPEAIAYCTQRGWSQQTIQDARLGYYDGLQATIKGLYAELKTANVHDTPIAEAILNLPPKHLIYTHWHNGRCVYMSARSIDSTTKRQKYNLPKILAGERQPYRNHLVYERAPHIVFVEGQPCAITLGQAGIAAAALCGVSGDKIDTLTKGGKKQQRYLALDSDAAGKRNVFTIAKKLGPKTKIVEWPATAPNGQACKDANDLAQHGFTAEQFKETIANGKPLSIYLAEQVAAADPLEREELLASAFDVIAQLKDFDIAQHKKQLCTLLNVSAGEFNGMVKAKRNEAKAVENKRDERPTMPMVTGYVAGHLFEMITPRTPDGDIETKFACRFPSGEIRIVDQIEFDKKIIVPYPPHTSFVAKDVIKFARTIKPFTTERDLLNQILAFIHRWVDVPHDFELMSAFYVMFTYHYDSFPKTPYIRRKGDYGGGKSRWLITLWALCNRGWMTTKNTTLSALYRTIEVARPTLFMDELEITDDKSEQNRAMLALINTGNDVHTGQVPRTNTESYETDFFLTWVPKAITQRKDFVDKATESRFLTDKVSSSGVMRDEIKLMIQRSEFWSEADSIRAQLVYWRLATWQRERRIDESLADRSISPRLNEVIIPLINVFEDQELHNILLNTARETHEQATADRSLTIEARVIEGIMRAFFTPTDRAIELAAKDPNLQLSFVFIAEQANTAIEASKLLVKETGEEMPRQKAKGISAQYGAKHTSALRAATRISFSGKDVLFYVSRF